MEAHALLVPYPGRGHVTLMMHLTLNFSSHGIPVTFMVTESWHKMITQADENAFTRAPNLRAALIPDCVVGESERGKNMTKFFLSLSNMEAHVAQLLTKSQSLRNTRDMYRGRCITQVSGSFCQKTRPAVCFAVSNVCHNFLVFYHLDLGLEGWKDYIARSPPLHPTDFPADLMPPSPLGDAIVECFSSVRTTDWIVANSFYALDCKAVQTLCYKTPVHCVGPFNIGFSSQLDTHCSEWLDSKPARLVIYVSFGSFHTVARPQVREIAAGLMKSGCYFLWALCPDNEKSHFSEMLPTECLDECEGRGIIAPWFMQAEGLKHPSMGGFLSHCGWNAVLESVSRGVPMLGFPLIIDQFINCKFIVEKWRFGLGLKNVDDGNRVIRAGEVESKVKMLMEGEESGRLRRAAERFRDVAEEEVSKGGWSTTNLEAHVNFISPSPIIG